MALACEDSRMSIDSDLSNLSPCKPIASDNKKTAATTTTTTINISSLLSAKDRCLLDEETDASASDCTAKDPHEESEPEQEPKSSHKRRVSQSWADIVEEEENPKQSLGKKDELKECKTVSALAALDSKMSMDESSNSNTSLRSNGSGRQIEIDIIESVNVEKYEKLVRDEKIKSPFKRRLSGGDGEDGEETCDGRATSDNNGETSGNGTPQYKKSKTDENDHGGDRSRRESSSSSSGDGSSQSSRKPMEYEKDLAILERRQKQIDYGKNTLGYENYLKQVPRDQRTNDHPKTPPKHIKYSRRAWDGVVRVWRKQLHCFDPDAKLDADD